GAHRHQDLLLDRHHVGRLHQPEDADALRHRLHLPVHRGRRHRREACQRRPVSGAAQHILRGGALPLRAEPGRRLLHLRRHLLLDRQDDGPAVPGVLGQGPLLDAVHRRQCDLLPAALPRRAGHAAALPGLPGRFLGLEPRVLPRRVRRRSLHARLPLRHLADLRRWREGGGELLGRGRDHAGVAGQLATPVPHLRRTAARAV
ncbi:MAG: Cytochrome c oxidase polypeptide I, partial [uncultured Acetobacteraceae bacterium]